MKVVLINPPRGASRPYFMSVQMPINIAYLAASLRKGGFDVEIWDYDVEAFTDSLFVERVSTVKPQVVGFGCFTPTVLNGHHLADLVKQTYPQTVTVAGGVHISALPERSLEEFSNFDYLVVGEGEITFFELCQKIEDRNSPGGINGILCRDGEEKAPFEPRALIADLDEVPYPARDLFKFNLYKGPTHNKFSRSYLNIVEIFTARGCPYECIFCASCITLGRNVRFRSIENICEEISHCKKEFKTNHLTFLDDTFTLNRQRTLEISRYLKENDLSWNATGTRVNTVDLQLLTEMANCGCVGLTFGVESGSQRILDLLKKRIKLDQVKNAVGWAQKAGIKSIELDFIIGAHPDETEDDLDSTAQLIKELKPDSLGVSCIVPYPGTEINRIMKEKGFLSQTENWNDFALFSRQKPSWRTTHFSSGDLFTFQRKLLTEYYFTLGYLLRRFASFESVGELVFWGKSVLNFILCDLLKVKKA